jgi:hypothetical protein
MKPKAEVFKELSGHWWALLRHEDYHEGAVFDTWARAMDHAEWLAYCELRRQDTLEGLRRRRVAGELGS